MKLFAVILALAGLMLLVLFIVLRLIGMSKKIRYEQDMIFLESCLHNWVVSQRNYHYLCNLFNDIHTNNQDEKRTQEQWEYFLDRYKDYLPMKKEQVTLPAYY